MKKFVLLLLFGCLSAQQFVPIHDIQYTEDPSGNSPYEGQVVTTVGVVTVPSGVLGNGFYIQDGEGPWSGIYVYTTMYTVQLGDSVRVTGTVQEYYNLTEISYLSELTVLKSGAQVPEPYPVTTGELGAGDLTSESYEGVLVRVDYAVVTNPSLGYGEWEINDGTGPCRVDDMAGYSYNPQLGDTILRLIGVQYYSFGNYKLEPRWDSDIILSVDGSGTATITPAEVVAGETRDVAITVEGVVDTLRSIEIILPEGLSWSESLELLDPGFADATFSVSGGGTVPYVVLVENARVAAQLGGTVLFHDVTFPERAGFYTFDVRTAGTGGTLTSIPDPPQILATNSDGTIPMGLLHVVDENGYSLLLGRSGVKIKGVVTVGGELGDVYYMQDTTGGAALYRPDIPLVRGDTALIMGTVTQFNGLIEFDNVAVLERKEGVEPNPIVLTCSSLIDSGEKYEGMLVKLERVTTNASYFPEDGTILIEDTTGTFTLFVDRETDLPGRPVPQGEFTVTGVISQYAPNPPFTSGYQIVPRGSFDIIAGGDGSGGAEPIYPLLYPGVMDTLRLRIFSGFTPLKYIKIKLPFSLNWSADSSEVQLLGDGFLGATYTVEVDTVDSMSVIYIEDANVEDDTVEIYGVSPDTMGIIPIHLETAVTTSAGLREIVRLPEVAVTMPIKEVQRPDSLGYNSSHLNERVLVGGVVTGPSSSFSSSGRTSFYIQDRTGGVNIYVGESGISYKLGDFVVLNGTVTEYNGLTEVSPETLDSINIWFDNFELPEPYTLRTSEVLKESLEGLLVELINGQVASLPVSAGSGRSFYVYNGEVPITVYVYNTTGIDLSNIKIGDIVNIKGIVGQYDYNPPYNGGYQLLPRFQSDIEIVSSGSVSEKVGLLLKVNGKKAQTFAPDLGEVLNIEVEGPLDRRYTLKVFDLKGRVRRTLYEMNYGPRNAMWDGRDDLGAPVDIGIYILQLRTVDSEGKEERINKVVVVGTPFK